MKPLVHRAPNKRCLTCSAPMISKLATYCASCADEARRRRRDEFKARQKARLIAEAKP